MKCYMPTIILEEDNVVFSSEQIFKKLGKKALIVTGRSSAKKSGALGDVLDVLTKCDIGYEVFDEVRENPLIVQAFNGAIKGIDCDFVIGIGGGSPMDTAKGIAVLIKNGVEDYIDKLFGKKDYDAVPVVAIPTTAGTGSEVTPYSIFTDEQKNTKVGMARRVFPKYALIDVKYFLSMPKKVRISTVVDAMTHAVESFVSTGSNFYSKLYSEKAMELFGEYKEYLFEDSIEPEIFKHFVRAATLAGIAISQTGTSLPHSLGYPLTFYYSVPHGVANGIFISEYLKVCVEDDVEKVLVATDFDSLDELGDYLVKVIKQVTPNLKISDEEIMKYCETMMQNTRKLKNHKGEVRFDDVLTIYRKSLEHYE